jgi:hypothetical protein
VGDHPLRQVVGLDAIGHGQLLQFRHQPPVPADDATDQPIVTQVVEPAFLAVALPGRVHQRQVTRVTKPMRVFALSFKEQIFKGDGDVLGETDADETTGGHGVAVLNQTHRVARGDDLPGVRGAQRGGDGMTGMRHDLSPGRIGW